VTVGLDARTRPRYPVHRRMSSGCASRLGEFIPRASCLAPGGGSRRDGIMVDAEDIWRPTWMKIPLMGQAHAGYRKAKPAAYSWMRWMRLRPGQGVTTTDTPWRWMSSRLIGQMARLPG